MNVSNSLSGQYNSFDSRLRGGAPLLIIGISAKIFQRWSHAGNEGDSRLNNQCVPHNKLSDLERRRLIKIANDPVYADLQPSKIVPKLADSGCYIASESTFYRVLKAENQLTHRQKTKPVRQQQKPKALIAPRPNRYTVWLAARNSDSGGVCLNATRTLELKSEIQSHRAMQMLQWPLAT